MDKKLKAKWVKALRSGNYPQGQNVLYAKGKFCCLGVLHICAGDTVDDIDGVTYGVADDLINDNGVVVADELAQLNDDGVPFEMIAGLIEETL
jgi:hypothetical protein